MTTSTIMILMVAVVVVIVLVLATQRSGPRVTHITRTVEKEDKDSDA